MTAVKTIAKKTRQLLEMIRFSHTVFALPFALLSAVIAWTTASAGGEFVSFRVRDLLGILVCMIAARSAAMSFNRLVDRRIDANNPRTATRHLPQGILSVRAVVSFTVLCVVMFLFGTLFFLPNRLPMILALPVIAVLLAYSYTKRFTVLAHFWLGLSLMLAPVGAWIALRGQFVLQHPIELAPPFVLGLAVLFWVAGFDIIYACQDLEFDRRANLKSIPSKFGIAKSLRIAFICHLLMIATLIVLPWVSSQVGLSLGFGWIYFLGVAGIAALLGYEHLLVRPDDLTRLNIAFFNVNAVVSFGMFIIGAIDAFV